MNLSVLLVKDFGTVIIMKGRGGQRVRVYRCKDCKGCEYFGRCTTSSIGQTVHVSEYEEFINQMRQKLSTPEGKMFTKLRKSIVEPVLGSLSHNLGFRGFLLRALQKVRGEFVLMCIAHNILKIAKFIRKSGRTLKEALNMPIVALNTP